MNIGVAYKDGQIADNLGDCSSFLIVSAEGKTPTGKRILEVTGTGTTDMVKTMSMEQIDVLICGSLGLRVVCKLLLLPLVMGISYELLKWCGRSDNIATRIIRQPVIWVQHLTVFEPDDSMIEVAIAAITPVLPENPEEGKW